MEGGIFLPNHRLKDSDVLSMIWHSSSLVSGSALEIFMAAIESHVDSVSWFLENPMDDEADPACLWRLEGWSRTEPDIVRMKAAMALAAAVFFIDPPDVKMRILTDDDWVAANLRDFPPVRIGRFFVHGSHFDGIRPSGLIPIMLDAGMAFGSGEHATTQGCLLAIDKLLRRRRFFHPLDMGCGSGILAVALAKSLHCRVVAADIDPDAVVVTGGNAKANNVASFLRPQASNGFSSRQIRNKYPYDLIVANILARPLVRMAYDIKKHLAKDGIIVISGLLDWQERFVFSAYRQQGLSLHSRFSLNGWVTLVLSR